MSAYENRINYKNLKVCVIINFLLYVFKLICHLLQSFHMIVKFIIMIKNKLIMIGSLNSNFVKNIIKIDKKETNIIILNLDFQFFISSLQSFDKSNPIGNAEINNIKYNKFEIITYLRLWVF